MPAPLLVVPAMTPATSAPWLESLTGSGLLLLLGKF
jgi:hypothetical protein